MWSFYHLLFCIFHHFLVCHVRTKKGGPSLLVNKLVSTQICCYQGFHGLKYISPVWSLPSWFRSARNRSYFITSIIPVSPFSTHFFARRKIRKSSDRNRTKAYPTIEWVGSMLFHGTCTFGNRIGETKFCDWYLRRFWHLCQTLCILYWGWPTYQSAP